MSRLDHLVCFVQTAELGSFSAAARALGLTPAAASKNIAALEARLALRLFHRSTRRLTLTEEGDRLLQQVRGPVAELQGALSGGRGPALQPAGSLKVSMGQAFGRLYLVPLLGGFLERYPAIVPDWHFDNRKVDLIGEGFDAAIGGGFALSPGLVSRELAQVYIVAVAAPAYLAGRALPKEPADLAGLDGIVRRSSPTGRVRPWTLRTRRSEERPVPCRPRVVLSDPEAVATAAMLGLGVALVPMPFAAPHLASGALVRVLPGWYSDAGPLSLYYPTRRLLPAKTRAFVDYVLERFSTVGFADLVDGR